MTPPPPRSTLFPYTTLFRSVASIMENTNLSKQQQVSEIMRQMLTQAQTAGVSIWRIISRSEERFSRNAETDLVCRLLLEKKKQTTRSPEPQLLAGSSPDTRV